MKRSPLKRKTPMRKRRPGRKILRAGNVPQNPDYLDYIRCLACLLAGSGDCEGIVEAAHVGERGMGQKCPDEESAPMCAGHHRTRRDSHHVLGRNFFSFHNLDREAIIRHLNRGYKTVFAEPFG